MDAAGLDALLDCIRHLHGVEATWRETVHVREEFNGELVWDGDIEVFDVKHAETSTIYAWSIETTGTKRRFYAVLGAHPINSPADAVRGVIASEYRARQH